MLRKLTFLSLWALTLPACGIETPTPLQSQQTQTPSGSHNSLISSSAFGAYAQATQILPGAQLNLVAYNPSPMPFSNCVNVLNNSDFDWTINPTASGASITNGILLAPNLETRFTITVTKRNSSATPINLDILVTAHPVSTFQFPPIFCSH